MVFKSWVRQRCDPACAALPEGARVSRPSGQTPRYAERYPLGRRETQTPVPTSRGTRPTDWLGNADQEREPRTRSWASAHQERRILDS